MSLSIVEWKPIEKIPSEFKDGRYVWIGIKRCYLDLPNIKIVETVLARYDTWIGIWRQSVDGKELRMSYCFEPLFYCECEMPPHHILKQLYESLPE